MLFASKFFLEKISGQINLGEIMRKEYIDEVRIFFIEKFNTFRKQKLNLRKASTINVEETIHHC